ncbi:MAG: tetratricopeptide repeat protein [Pseudanabaenales cyanobacterium]|nr:tetratricopeptide repeat protein [Pseudanabaenales cyanobacterium]
MGDAYVQQGQYQEAATTLQPTISILQEIGDRQIEQAVYINLGKAYAGLKQFTEAIQFFNYRLEITRDLGDRLEEILALSSLSVLYFEAKEFERTIENSRQVLYQIDMKPHRIRKAKPL